MPEENPVYKFIIKKNGLKKKVLKGLIMMYSPRHYSVYVDLLTNPG